MLTYHNVCIETQIGIELRKRAVLKTELKIDDIYYAVNAIKFKSFTHFVITTTMLIWARRAWLFIAVTRCFVATVCTLLC